MLRMMLIKKGSNRKQEQHSLAPVQTQPVLFIYRPTETEISFHYTFALLSEGHKGEICAFIKA